LTRGVTAAFNEYYEKYTVHEEQYEMGGHFYPLSVWNQKGYDQEVIKAQSLSSNIRDDRMWGSVYRVPILYVAERHTEAEKHGGGMSCKAEGKLAKVLKHLESSVATTGVNDGITPNITKGDSDDSDTTTSPSSSSSGKKNKKEQTNG
jgi:hypothetical protein